MTPPRRWSFSLRMMLVVVTLLAVPLGWVAYQLNWIRQAPQGPCRPLGASCLAGHAGTRQRRGFAPAPDPLRWFGETGVYAIVFSEKPGRLTWTVSFRCFRSRRFKSTAIDGAFRPLLMLTGRNWLRIDQRTVRTPPAPAAGPATTRCRMTATGMGRSQQNQGCTFGQKHIAWLMFARRSGR